jgi:hypothetical protein
VRCAGVSGSWAAFTGIVSAMTIAGVVAARGHVTRAAQQGEAYPAATTHRQKFSRLEGRRRVATSRAPDRSGKLGVRYRSAGEHFVSARSVRPLASSSRVPGGLRDLPTGLSSCPCHSGGGAYPGGIGVDAAVGDSNLAWRMPAKLSATRDHLPPFCRVCRSTCHCVREHNDSLPYV